MSHWTRQQDNHIVTLTLNRAHALNTLTPEVLFELRELATELANDRSAWVVVLQSEGPHFSAGVDVNTIGQMQAQSTEELRANVIALQSCLDALEALPQLSVARLRGHCIGGGLIMALCCTFRVADDSARFWLPEVQLGIPVIMGTQRVTRTVGLPATRRLILLAQPMSADEALRVGLVDQVTAPEELDAAVQTLTARLASLPPLTLSRARDLIERGASMTLADSQALEVEAMLALQTTRDFAEGVRAFHEKRVARFVGE